jgi:acetyl esterase/lipase
MWVDPLLRAGYTVFAVNHRAAPRFRHPAAVEDCRRAVRFIRHHAARFGIDGSRLGAVGYSSGAHLASMLGVLDAGGTPASPDPVERESAGVQCVVGGATASDLTQMVHPFFGPGAASYTGVLTFFSAPGSEEMRVAADASPLTHVSPGDAPHLLIHGEADEIIPCAQTEALAEKLRGAGVPVEVVKIPGGTHMNTRPPGGPDYTRDMVRFLDTHLRGVR